MNAAELILKKALVASKLDSKEWNQVQAAFRNRAFFSSQVAQANIIQAMRGRVAEYAERGVDISEARKLMRADLDRAHYQPDPGKEGTIKDLYSKARLDVILKHNLRQARGMIQRARGMSPGAFAAFPAQEFKRTHKRQTERKDWPERWHKAGGKVYGGRMIALKTDPVWERLSVFGNPFPPFDWGSGMGVIGVDRKTAIELGLVTDEKLREETAALRSAKPEAAKFNDNLQATVPNLRKDSLCGQILLRNFGDQVAIENSVVSWQGNLIQDVISGKRKKAQLGVGYNGRPLPISHNFFKEHLSKHYGKNETHPNSIPLRDSDYELIPAMWHKPDKVSKSGDRDHLEFETLDGYILHLFVSAIKGIRSFYKTKSGRSLQ
ncbi:MAG: hypothetical protein IKL02_06540 [Kiritimatiellae bacterium]|nr:hypothetical protein [Kiritimatiellia bacterium]MBR3777230.1 hypothetical protein [Kiritimatiellia bacterium]